MVEHHFSITRFKYPYPNIVQYSRNVEMIYTIDVILNSNNKIKSQKNENKYYNINNINNIGNSYIKVEKKKKDEITDKEKKLIEEFYKVIGYFNENIGLCTVRRGKMRKELGLCPIDDCNRKYYF
jgi:hypothetical protein